MPIARTSSLPKRPRYQALRLGVLLLMLLSVINFLALCEGWERSFGLSPYGSLKESYYGFFSEGERGSVLQEALASSAPVVCQPVAGIIRAGWGRSDGSWAARAYRGFARTSGALTARSFRLTLLGLAVLNAALWTGIILAALFAFRRLRPAGGRS